MSANTFRVNLSKLKPEFQSTMPVRRGLRETLKDFPGLLEYAALEPMSQHDTNQFADVAKWTDYECASAAAKAFEVVTLASCRTCWRLIRSNLWGISHLGF